MDVKESGEDKENAMLPATSFSVTGLVGATQDIEKHFELQILNLGKMD